MNIVQVCPYAIDRPGGVQRHILDLSHELERLGHLVRIVSPGPGSGQPDPHRIYLGGHREIGFSGTRFEISRASRNEIAEVMRELENWGADIFHFHTMWTPLLPMQLFSRCRGVRVATFHDTPPDTFEGRLLRQAFVAMSRWLLARLDGAIAVSEAPLGHLSPGGRGVTPVILPPSVDLSSYEPLTTPRQPDDTLSVLFLGRFEPRKGIDTLLKAWQQVDAAWAGRDRPLRLVVAGQGKQLKDIRAAKATLRASELQIVEAPARAEVRRLMRETDVFVAPSPYGESFGIVLLEAMASGAPVIAADNPGYRTIVTDTGRSALVAPGDHAGLAQKILTLLDDPQQRRKLREWGLSRAAEFDIQRFAPHFVSFYEEASRRHVGEPVEALPHAGAR